MSPYIILGTYIYFEQYMLITNPGPKALAAEKPAVPSLEL